MDNEWLSILTTNRIHIAEMAKFILQNNEIESVILNQKDTNYLFGFYEIYVRHENAIRAKHLVKELTE